jgi:carbon starvation protein CstA
LPIDKIIGKIYPLFAFALLFMALGLMIALFVNWPNIPEVTDFATNRDPDAATTPIFPCLFITIACGAISGFHSTQSPLMARCLKHEKYGYPVFYGAMITEGIVALVWAAVSSYFFFDVTSGNTDMTVAAPKVVEVMSIKWLGVVGGVLAVLGVVAAPVTSGDTAFRSARLMIADALHIAQKKFLPRLYIAIPLFLAAIGLLFYNLRDPRGFNIIWGYFAWANQTLAVFTLWTITVYMVRNKKPYLVALIPAIFMTTVCATYTCVSAKNGFGLSLPISYTVSVICVITCIVWFSIWYHKYGRHQTEDDGSQSINKIEK